MPHKLIQPPILHTNFFWVPVTPSPPSTLASAAMLDQQLPPQQNSLLAIQLMQQHFEEAFLAMQQQIWEQAATSDYAAAPLTGCPNSEFFGISPTIQQQPFTKCFLA